MQPPAEKRALQSTCSMREMYFDFEGESVASCVAYTVTLRHLVLFIVLLLAMNEPLSGGGGH